MSNPFDYVKALIIDASGVDSDLIVPNANLKSDVGLDSLDITEIVMLYEEQSGTDVSDEQLASLVTVSDFVNLHKELSGEQV